MATAPALFITMSASGHDTQKVYSAAFHPQWGFFATTQPLHRGHRQCAREGAVGDSAAGMTRYGFTAAATDAWAMLPSSTRGDCTPVAAARNRRRRRYTPRTMADVDSRSGAAYHTPAILQWVDALHHAHDSALAYAFDAPAAHGMPAIQVGRGEGALLGMLLRLAGARRVVEVGTLAGYSTVHLARAVGPEGHVWSIEYDPRHAAVARDVLARAGLGDRVTVLEGAGVDVLPALVAEGPFDAVFLDADKVSYDRYGRWAAANLRPGGMLVGDNVYLFGRLLGEADDAAAMRRFHTEAAAHFDTVCVPTPDGLLLGIKR